MYINGKPAAYWKLLHSKLHDIYAYVTILYMHSIYLEAEWLHTYDATLHNMYFLFLH